MSVLLTTTGTQDPVVLADLGDRSFSHPTTDYDLRLEYTPDELNSSADLQAALDAGHITLTVDGESVTSVENQGLHQHQASQVTDFQAAVSSNADVTANTADRHQHANQAELDLVTDGDHDQRTDNPHATTASQVGAAETVHSHVAADVTDFQTAVSANSDVAANVSARHSHANKAELDLITDGDHDQRTDNPHGVLATQLTDFQTQVSANTDVSANTANRHSHSNKAELDLVTDGDHDQRVDNPHGVTKTQVGLGNVLDVEQIPASEKGQPNGVATLDSGGKVPASQLDVTGLDYQGAWDANTNTPTLTSGVGTKNHYYVVSVAGNTNLDGITDWGVGDWAIFNGTAWEKIDNTDAVTSVAGKTGAVTLDSADITDFQSAVSSNADVAANTSARHSHSNKAELDLVTDGDHDVRTDNPHGVTKTQVGLGNVTDDAQLKRAGGDWSGFTSQAGGLVAGDKVLIERASDGAKRVVDGADIGGGGSSVHYGSTPPASTDTPWFNTDPNYACMMAWDSVRSKWLSVQRATFQFGEDRADGQYLSIAGVNTAGSRTAHLCPLAFTITRVYARARGGNVSKVLDVRIDGSNVLTATLSGREYVNNAADVDGVAMRDISVWAQSGGTPTYDISFIVEVAWRYVP